MIDGNAMSVWTQAVHGYLTGASSSRFRDQEVTITDQWQGRDNLLWRVRCGDGADAVVKMFTDAGQARSRRQFRGQEQFAAAGLAPEPLWYDRYPHGLPSQILVYRWAEGGELSLADGIHRIALAEAVARVHCTERDAVQRFSPHPFNLLTFWQVWQAGEAPLREWVSAAPAPLLNELLSMLWSATHRLMDEALPLLGETPPAPIHGDLAAENALFDRGRTLLVDWEFFGLGDPAQEIARFLFYGGDDWSEDDRAEWRKLYLASNAEPGLPERVELYLRLFNFQAVTYLLEGIRQGSAPVLSGTDSAAHSLTDYGTFLIDALTVAVRRSLNLWGLTPLKETDGPLLANEIERLMNIQLPERHASATTEN
jgi:thiamine kinase-like enzyme